MPVKIESNLDLMLMSKTALLSYFDNMLGFHDKFSYKSIIERKSFLKALDALDIKHDKEKLYSQYDIAEFIDNLPDSLSNMVDEMYSSVVKSAVSAYSKIDRTTLFGIDIYTFRLVDEDVDEPVPRMHMLDKADFLNYLDEIYKRDDNCPILSFVNNVPIEEYIKICECQEDLYHDFQMAVDQTRVKSTYQNRLLTGTQSIPFKKIVENLLFNDKMYKVEGFSVCKILDAITEHFAREGSCDYDNFKSAAIVLDEEIHYFFPA